jgi:hypothetical protein
MLAKHLDLLQVSTAVHKSLEKPASEKVALHLGLPWRY